MQVCTAYICQATGSWLFSTYCSHRRVVLGKDPQGVIMQPTALLPFPAPVVDGWVVIHVHRRHVPDRLIGHAGWPRRLPLAMRSASAALCPEPFVFCPARRCRGTGKPPQIFPSVGKRHFADPLCPTLFLPATQPAHPTAISVFLAGPLLHPWFRPHGIAPALVIGGLRPVALVMPDARIHV